MKKIFLVFSLIVSTPLFAQTPHILWQKCIGGSDDDRIFSVQQTTDGGYIMAGTTKSTNGDAAGNTGDHAWVVKMTAAGAVDWQHTYGGTKEESAMGIIQTTDGGYIFTGGSTSSDGDVTANHGESDCWVVKLSATGTIQWQRSYGGSKSDGGAGILQTADGGYIVAATTSSYDGDLSGYWGLSDYWVIKLDATGNIQWNKPYGGTDYDEATCIRQIVDGSYFVGGYSRSKDNYVPANHGFYDIFILQLKSAAANTTKLKMTIGGTGFDGANSVEASNDGGFIVAGYTTSKDSDIPPNHGGRDMWVLKIDTAGTVIWQKCLGSTGNDEAACIRKTAGGGYIIGGKSDSKIDGDVTSGYGSLDFWVIKLSESGNIVWQRSFGGSGGESITAIEQTSDNGYIISGVTSSTDGDVTGFKGGGSDAWIVKIDDPTGIDDVNKVNKLSLAPNPTTGLITIAGSDKVNIAVYNTIGQLLKTGEHTDNISIAELPVGTYLVKIMDIYGQVLLQQKVVKQ